MRPSRIMELILWFPLFCGVGLCADEARDRAAIDNVITALNDPAQRAALFTKDFDGSVDFDHLVDLHRKLRSPCVVIGTDETWTELTVPRVVSSSIRFITPDVAIVDGASTIRGAATLVRSVPLLFIMKKTGAEWRISAVRDGNPAHGGTMVGNIGLLNH